MVRTMYRELEEGDAQALAGRVDTRIEWVHPLVVLRPYSGVQRGWPAVLRHAFRRRPDGTGPRISPETFLEFGDCVLVVGRFLRRGGAEGKTSGEPFMHECFVRDGKVFRIREYRVDPPH